MSNKTDTNAFLYDNLDASLQPANYWTMSSYTFSFDPGGAITVTASGTHYMSVALEQVVFAL